MIDNRGFANRAGFILLNADIGDQPVVGRADFALIEPVGEGAQIRLSAVQPGRRRIHLELASCVVVEQIAGTLERQFHLALVGIGGFPFRELAFAVEPDEKVAFEELFPLLEGNKIDTRHQVA